MKAADRTTLLRGHKKFQTGRVQTKNQPKTGRIGRVPLRETHPKKAQLERAHCILQDIDNKMKNAGISYEDIEAKTIELQKKYRSRKR